MRAFGKLRLSALPSRNHFQQGIRLISADSRVFAEGDYVLLREVRDKFSILTKPLHQSKSVHSHHGYISHNDIIGKRVWETVETNKGVRVTLHEPTLDEYVRHTPRLVTPIYPSDANVIVQLLDLHATVSPSQTSDEPDSPRLEILEAGTGHGGLTLHLARAVHPANPPLSPNFQSPGSPDEELERWHQSRRAIVHTVDVKERYSKHARSIVRGFRRGVYYGDVDFHVSDVSSFIKDQFSKRSSKEPFLSAAILDMPSADDHLQLVSKALRVDGKLIVFNPNITQIADCVQHLKRERLLLRLEKVLELGVGISGGRDWDVRLAHVRANQAKQPSELAGDRATTGRQNQSLSEDERRTSEDEEDMSEEHENKQSMTTDSQEPIVSEPQENGVGKLAMVCRPKVGKLIIGGGFVGLWTKMREW